MKITKRFRDKFGCDLPSASVARRTNNLSWKSLYKFCCRKWQCQIIQSV